jgi:DNA-binding transcriptional ArsR family regulator
MLEVLLERAASVLQLAEPHPLSLPTLLQHLGALEKYGLMRTRKAGRETICSIEPDALYAAERWLRTAM